MKQSEQKRWTRREALGLLGCTATYGLTQSIEAFAKEGDPPPNIVFIFADDLGWHQLGCYGSDYYETPNLNRFATEGMRFTDAYAAAPVCSPTRASLMTGKYPARLHLTDFIPGRKSAGELEIPDWTRHLPLEETTIPEVLHKAGYVSGHFGKWHLNEDKEYAPGRPGDPGSQGFDEVFTTHKPRLLTNKDVDPENDPHNVTKITDRAIDFMKKNKEKPFFCYVTHNSIHAPEIEDLELIAKYEKKEGADNPQNKPALGAMLEKLDKGVGRVLETIDELGLRENTLVVFFADNGMLGDPGIHPPLRGSKGYLYEGGIRVPMIVRWPGKIEPGSTSSEVVISNDFLPTLAKVAGVEVEDEEVDGIDILPALEQKGELDRERIFFHYPHYSPQGTAPMGAIRQGKYKLLMRYGSPVGPNGYPDDVELYDLEADRGETTNLVKKLPDTVKDLYKEFHDWFDDVGAQRMGLIKEKE